MCVCVCVRVCVLHSSSSAVFVYVQCYQLPAASNRLHPANKPPPARKKSKKSKILRITGRLNCPPPPHAHTHTPGDVCLLPTERDEHSSMKEPSESSPTQTVHIHNYFTYVDKKTTLNIWWAENGTLGNPTGIHWCMNEWICINRNYTEHLFSVTFLKCYHWCWRALWLPKHLCRRHERWGHHVGALSSTFVLHGGFHLKAGVCFAEVRST